MSAVMKPYIGMRELVTRWGSEIVAALAIALGFFVLYAWRLATLPAHFSPDEVAAKTASASVSAIANNPVNLPHKILQLGLQSLGHHGPLAMRSVSVFFIICAVVSFYILIKWWFDRRLALLSTIAFAVSPSVIIAARNATTTSLLICALTAMMTSYLWLQAARKSELAALICFFTIAALSLYVPGMIWVIAIGAIFFSQRLLRQARSYHNLLPYILLLIFTVLSIPLIFVAISKPMVGREILLLPDHLWSITESLKSIAWTGLGFVWRTRNNLPTTLGYLPVFDIFAIITAVFGVFHLLKQYSRRRTYVIIGSIAIVIIAAGLRADFLLCSLVISMMYILVAAGLDYLLNEWFSVFPRNPIARWTAIFVLSFTLLVHVIYGVRYALIAWPTAPETKTIYMLK